MICLTFATALLLRESTTTTMTSTTTTTTTTTTTRSCLDLAGDVAWNANLRSLLLAARHTGTIGVFYPLFSADGTSRSAYR